MQCADQFMMVCFLNFFKNVSFCNQLEKAFKLQGKNEQKNVLARLSQNNMNCLLQ